MDRAQRIDRIAPFETASTSLGLGLFLVWFSQVPPRTFLPSDPLLLSSFLFAFGVCCALLARTRLPGAGSFSRAVWLTPCLLLPLPLFERLWAPLKIPALLLPAFASALLFCRWMTLCARFSPRLFLLLYSLSSLVSIAGTPPLSRTGPLLYALPFLSTGLLLLSVRERPWMPEGERYVRHAPSTRESFALLVFALILNGAQTFSASHLSRSGTFPPGVLRNLAALLPLAGLLALLYLRKPVSYRTLLAGALSSWVAGIALSGLSASAALLLTSSGCLLFELSFWLLMLQYAADSPNPARMLCIGASLLVLALIASRRLLDVLAPFGMEVLSVQSGFTLFMGLVAGLLLFLPGAIVDVPAAASAATPVPAVPIREPDAAPSAELSAEERELRLKGRFEALGLTRQECRIALMILNGAGDSDLCGELFISKNTLKFHIRNINRKLGIATRRDLPATAQALLAKEPGAMT